MPTSERVIISEKNRKTTERAIKTNRKPKSNGAAQTIIKIKAVRNPGKKTRIKRANASFLRPTQKCFDAVIVSKHFYQTMESARRKTA